MILHYCTKPRHCSRYMGIVSSQTFPKLAACGEIFTYSVASACLLTEKAYGKQTLAERV